MLEQHAAEWRDATQHQFLASVADGSLQRAVFDSWLAQDYLFVGDLLVFQARLVSRAPRCAQAVLVAGLVGLEAELSWFEAHAGQRGLRLEVSRRRTTSRYQGLLTTLESAPYPVAATGLWAIERAYLDAWRSAAPGAPAYHEFVAHWTAPEFAEYVGGLQGAADAALASASVEELAGASDAFVDVARLEHDFWEMAWRAV
jgi:thiaminase/transcriptional activator TenA